MKKLIMLKIIIIFTMINLYSETPLITSSKQIKDDVKENIVKNSNTFKYFVNQTTTSINALNLSTQELQGKVNNLGLSTQSLQGQVNDLDNRTIKKPSDIITNLNLGLYGNSIIGFNDNGSISFNDGLGHTTSLLRDNLSNNFPTGFNFNGNYIFNNNLNVNGAFGVGTQGIWNGGDLTNIGKISAGNNSFQVETKDAFQRNQIWYKDTNSILRLGSDTSDGDPTNVDSEGIVVYQPSNDNLARIKADRFGLTRASDSSYYYFRIDKDNFFYKSTDTLNTRLYIDNNTGNVGIGTKTPLVKLEINGSVNINTTNSSNNIQLYLCVGGTYDKFITADGTKCSGGTSQLLPLKIGY